MKNILLIIDSLGKGGAENSLAKLSLALSKHYRIYILVFFQNDEIPWEFNGEIINIQEPASTSFFDSVAKIFRRIRNIKKIKRDLNISTSISFMEALNFYNILTRQNDKVIISIRGSKLGDVEVRGLKGFVFNKLISLLYNRSDVIVPVSKGIEEELVSEYGVERSRIKVLYDLYDINKLTLLGEEPLEQELVPVFDHPVLINSGRLHVQKGQEYLLRIFASVKQKHSAVKLVILGEGELRDRLFDICSELKLTAWCYGRAEKINDSYDVYFLGFKKNPHIYIKRSSIFLFPSLYEGFPNALCEAMALGLPAIASDCPTGPVEIFTDTPYSEVVGKNYKKYGVLIPPFNVNAKNNELINDWVEAVSRLLSDPIMYSNYCRASADRISDFSFEMGAKAWSELM